jgi:acyl-coenzyme A synthetase/AMP-(fatty) acid ligase
VEEALLAHEAVADCACVASPDPERGNIVKAFVVLKPASKGQVADTDIVRWCRENMAAYKAPRIVYVVDELPRTRNGKLQRSALAPALGRARAERPHRR